MGDINFEKTAAVDVKGLLQGLKTPILIGGATGAVGGVKRGVALKKQMINEAVADQITRNTITYPAHYEHPTYKKFMEDILGSRDLYDFSLVNGAVDPNHPYWGALKKQPNLTVIKAAPKESILRDIITKSTKDQTIRQKLVDALHAYGKPAAIGAAIGIATPVITQLLNKVLAGAVGAAQGMFTRDKETSKENMAKAAAEAMVNQIMTEEGITEDDIVISKIATNSVDDMISKYGR